HPHSTRAIGGLVDQGDARCADPLRCSIHRGKVCDVDGDQQTLALDPVPAQLAVVLVEHEPGIAARDDGSANLALILELLEDTEAEHFTEPANRVLDIAVGERDAELGRWNDWCGSGHCSSGWGCCCQGTCGT